MLALESPSEICLFETIVSYTTMSALPPKADADADTGGNYSFIISFIVITPSSRAAATLVPAGLQGYVGICPLKPWPYRGVTSYTACRALPMPTRSPDPPRILGQCPEARPSMRHIRDLVLVPILPISLTTHRPIALTPCVDGSELARTFLNVCSIGRCSHVFGLFARFT